jgi:hypothetical protein
LTPCTGRRGSKTSAEIALSIMTEVVAVKNGVQLPEPAGLAEGKSHKELPPHQTAITPGHAV